MSRKLGFLHIPRTAGGSIVEALSDEQWIILGHDVESAHFLHIKDYRKHHAEDNTYFITTVRNPYDRLVSAYHYLMQGGDNKMDERDKQLYLEPYKDFEQFVLKGLSWWKRRKTMQQIHLRPQHFWTNNKQKQALVDRIFNFENLDELFEFISAHSSISKTVIPHVHASNRSQFNDYYSQKMKKIISDCYRRDFVQFAYAMK